MDYPQAQVGQTMSGVTLQESLERSVADRYRIIRELGSGGMAVVFLADDLRHGRQVALKVLRPDIAASLGVTRFLNEIRIAARLQHEHILGLFDSGEVDGTPYYTMPYIEGESLRDRLAREHQLPLDDAMGIVQQVTDALDYAHRHGVVHRDIKPGNILLLEGRAFVADFGIARAVLEAGTDDVTRSGLAVGTPAYMSPEQASGESHVDARADIYALGCVLYEMLGGDPPFTGRSAQAVLARHLHDPPPSLRVVRPLTPPALEAVIERALAKIPADRFGTAAEFGRALVDARAQHDAPARPRRPGLAWRLGALGAVVAALFGWRIITTRNVRLDAARVIVFPLRDRPEYAEGEGVATYVGYALEGAASVRWLEGWNWLTGGQRTGRETVSGEVAAEISRRQRARYYVDGSILRGPDSITVVLRLHDVAGDSVVKTTGASAPATEHSVAQIGLEAFGELLPVLLPPGRKIDLSALSKRPPVAVAAFLQGEREYRRMRFERALEQYRRAVQSDSGFALAALRGAQAANWRERNDEAKLLTGVALASREGLFPRYHTFAVALRSYLAGEADSAVAGFRQALALDDSWSDAWMALGDVYYHLLPRGTAPDSIAEAAFLQAERTDSTFTPPLFHLLEIALRRGDVRRSRELIQDLRGAGLDSALDARLSLMLNCVENGPGQIDWRGAVARNAPMVLSASRLLSVGARQGACAEAGFRSLLESEGVAAEQEWGALLGLQGLLTAQGRLDDLEHLVDSEVSRRLWGRVLYLVVAASGAGLDRRAAEVAREVGTAYETLGSAMLWALGGWAAHRGAVRELEGIAAALRAKADSTASRADRLLTDAMTARAMIAAGDTAAGLARLEALTPNAPVAELEWQAWEALPGERLALAELLLARGDFRRADEVASSFDAPQPVVYLTYLPAALRLRIKAARGAKDERTAARYEARLAAMQAARTRSP
jgi:protein kinase-like protein